MPAPYYRNDGPWGSGKGARLTSLEHDQTIHALVLAIEDAVASIPPNVGIVNVTYTDVSITFVLSDDSEVTVPLPAPMFHPQGPWLNGATYNYGDLVIVPTLGVYLVLVEHTTPDAPAEFDPLAVDETTDENPLYSLIFPFQDVTGFIKYRGAFVGLTAYAIYDLIQSAEFGTFIVLQNHVSEASFDPFEETTDGPLYRQIAGPARVPGKAVTTDTYTLTRTDANHYIRCTNAAGCVITVPNNDDVPFERWDEIHIRVATDGAVSIVADDSSILIDGIIGFQDAASLRGAVMTLKNIDENEWDLFGLLAEEVSV